MRKLSGESRAHLTAPRRGISASGRTMTDLTLEQARAEAVRRWGAGGRVEFRPPRTPRSRRGRLARYPCTVGNGGGGAFRSIEGQGETWLEAFADVRPR